MNKPVIVCVDDEPNVLQTLKRELKRAVGNEYIIETADNGQDALSLFAELLEEKREIALVISDYIMPGIKGDELLRLIHQISPRTIKIMLTVKAELEAVGNAIKHAKLYRYITKPWQSEDLQLTVIEAVHSYLQDKKLAEQNVKLQQMNQQLEQLNHEQAVLIAKLHENESRLTKFLEAMPVGVEVIDANGTPYYINQKAQELLGKGVVLEATAEQIAEVYQHYIAGTTQVYPSEKLPLVRALKGESTTADNIEIHTGDKIIPIEAWGTPIYNKEGSLVYALAAFQDITKRKQAEAEREKFTEELFELNQSFSRFVPRQFLQFLGKKSIIDVQLGDQVQQEMSVLFSDIRSFTTLSEKMTPEDNFKFINAYLSRMEPAIIEYQGFIDKYIGDEIMALFSGEADNAVKAAISMLHRLAEYNTTRQRPERPPLKIGIGINTGSLMLGTVGGHSRMDSTVISDAVNLAARLENLTKDYGVNLLISHHTFARLQNPTQYAIRLLDQVKVKGKSKSVAVFEVLDGEPEEIRQAKLATKTIFEEALLLYYRHSFKKAAEYFQECLRQNPWDRAAEIYLKRSHQQRTLEISENAAPLLPAVAQGNSVIAQ
ncbi:tetratricopeptide repeat protein [Lyngbya aestuarii]|uniref:tetratricopeptide repeat protein n=1 Tax=Lyngbya aestuarii TaxID=118322 RepID=UPI00403E344A